MMEDQGTVDERVAAQAQRAPQAAALIAADETVTTFGDLQRRVEGLAGSLQRLEIATGSRVGIFLERPEELLVAALGVMRAGDVFVPIEPDEPRGRVAGMVEDAGIVRIVTCASSESRLAGVGCELLRLDSCSAEAPTAAPLRQGAGPACVVFRSGGAGGPVGIPVGHRALVPPPVVPYLRPSDRVAVEPGFAHDVSGFVALHALSCGASVVSDAGWRRFPPRRLAEVLRDREATVWVTASSVLVKLARQFPWALKRLRLLLCDDPWGLGDEVMQGLEDDVLEHCCRLYGAPELDGVRMLSYGSRDETAPQAHVPADTRLEVLDERLEPVPEGGVGEICITTAPLALSYARWPAATAASWVPDPRAVTPGGCLYRTGDLARRREGGLEPAGRRDRRLWIRGRRLEPEEIEAELFKHPGVDKAEVCDEGGSAGPHLVATVVPASGARLTAAELQSLLRERFPELLLPHLVVLASLDQETALVRALEAIWCEVLGKEGVDLDVSFFDVGGQSMALVEVAALINERLGKKVDIMTLFAHPTIESLAANLTEGVQD